MSHWIKTEVGCCLSIFQLLGLISSSAVDTVRLVATSNFLLPCGVYFSCLSSIQEACWWWWWTFTWPLLDGEPRGGTCGPPVQTWLSQDHRSSNFDAHTATTMQRPDYGKQTQILSQRFVKAFDNSNSHTPDIFTAGHMQCYIAACQSKQACPYICKCTPNICLAHLHRIWHPTFSWPAG